MKIKNKKIFFGGVGRGGGRRDQGLGEGVGLVGGQGGYERNVGVGF